MRNKSGLSPSAFHFTMLFSLFFTIFAFLGPVFAATTDTISFQSKLTNSDGTNISNGTYNFRFRMYSVASGGSVLWSEDRSLLVNAGVVSVDLGAVQSFPSDLFDNADLYLQVCFDANGADADSSDANCGGGSHRYEEVFSTRKAITAVPVALRAKYLTDGAGNAYGANDFFQQGGNSFGGVGVIGTTDNFGLEFRTNDNVVGTFDTSGTFEMAGLAKIGAVAIDDAPSSSYGPAVWGGTFDNGLTIKRDLVDLSMDVVTGSLTELNINPSTPPVADSIGSLTFVHSNAASSENLASLYGVYSEAIHSSSGTADYVYGGYFSASRDTDTGGSVGTTYGISAYASDGDNIIGGSFVANRQLGATNVDTKGISSFVSNQYAQSSGTDNTYGSYVSVSRQNATGGTLNTYGLYAEVGGDNAGAGVHTTYGLYLENFGGGDSNYALYTNGTTPSRFGGNITTEGVLGIKETGTTPAYYTYFQGGDQSGDITYTLPTASTNGVLTNTGGVLSWAAGGGGGISQVGSMTSSLVFGDATADDDWLGLGATAGRIEFDDLAIDEINFLAARVGIGTSTPTDALSLVVNETDTSVWGGGMSILYDYAPTTSGTGAPIGIYNNMSVGSGNVYDLGYLIGIQSEISNDGSGDISEISGLNVSASNSGSGLIQRISGASISVGANDGTVDAMYGLVVSANDTVPGVTDLYGIYVGAYNDGLGDTQNRYTLYLAEDEDGSTAVNDFGLYAADPNVYNYFAGNVGIGTATPSSFVFQVAGDIGPDADDTYDLGSSSLRFRDLYLGGNTLHIGSSLTDEGTISYNTTTNVLGISTDSTTNGDIAFFTSQLFLDKSSGNVGIGTTAPLSTLNIADNAGPVTLTSTLLGDPGTSGAFGRYAFRAETTEAPSWTTSYNTPEVDVRSFAYDYENNVLYAAAGGGNGVIYRCPVSTGCDASGDWTEVYDASSLWDQPAIVFDAATNTIFSTSDGVVSRCDTSTGCDAPADWANVFTGGDQDIVSLLIDTTESVLYAGSSWDYGIIYRCDIVATGCDAQGDFTTSFDSPDDGIETMVYDAENGTIYAGSEWGGEVYRCDTATDCDTDTDWTVSGDLPGSGNSVNALVIDTANDVLYATSDEVIYRCPLSSGCDALTDWSISFDTNLTAVYSLGYDATHERLFAGTGNTGIIYQCATSTGCDSAGDWVVSYDSTQNSIVGLGIVNGVVYAGSANGGFIYRFDDNTSPTYANYAAIEAYAVDTVTGTEDGRLSLKTMLGGTEYESLRLSGNASTFYTSLSVGSSVDQLQFAVRNNATQTTNLVEFQNSVGTALTSINSSGHIDLSGNATPNAWNTVLKFNSDTLGASELAGGFTNGFIRSSTGRLLVNYITDNAANSLFGGGVSGDAYRRFTMGGDGKWSVGDGTGAQDTNLYRSAANQWTTDDSFRVNATLGIMEGTGSTFYTYFQGGDQSGDITYTLPTASTNGVLTNTGGVLSWAAGGGGGISQVGSMTSSIVFGDATADDDWLGLGASAGRIAFDDQTIDYVNILDANVGIGTSTPTTFMLQVAGSIGPNSNDTYDLGSNTLRFKDLYLGGDTLHLGASVFDEGTIAYNATTNIFSFGTDSSTNGDIAFFTNDLYLQKSTGFVGIGSVAPSANLTVQGTESSAILGNELLTTAADRDFSSSSGNWSGSNWTIGSGVATHTVGATNFSHTFTPVAGTTYQVTASLTKTSVNGSIYPQLGGASGVSYEASGVAIKWVLVATSTQALRFVPDSSWTGSIDDISVKELIPANPLLAINNSDGTAGIVFRSGGITRYNTFAGVDVGRATIDGSFNTGFGYGALKSNGTGSNNAAFGLYSLQNNTSGYSNIAFGNNALQKNLTGYSNIAIGVQSLYSNTSGSGNTSVGQSAMYLNTKGFGNTAVGMNSLSFNTTGSYNVGLGYGGLYSNTSGSGNVGIGFNAGYANTTGSYNVALGDRSLYWNQTGIRNIGIGIDTLRSASNGNYNVALGTTALYSLSNQQSGLITAIEDYSEIVPGTVLVTAPSHFFSSGTTAGVEISDTLHYDGTYTITYVDSDHFYITAPFVTYSIASITDYDSVEPGAVLVTLSSTYNFSSSYVDISGTANYDGNYDVYSVDEYSFYIYAFWWGDEFSGTAIFEESNGIYRYFDSPAGDNNVAIGSYAGYTLIRGSNNTFLGAASGQTSQSTLVSNSTAIGYGAYTTADNQIVLGNTSVTQTLIRRGTLGLSETGVSPQYYTFFQGGDQSGNITYTLPTASTNGVLTNTGGVLSWAAGGGISQVGSMTSSLVFGDATADDDWLGLGASAGRIAFDDQTIDYVNILDANVGIGTTTPDAKLTIQGTNTSAVLGSELLTVAADRDFSSNSGNWTGTNWTIAGGAASHSTPASNLFIHTYTPTSGRTYQITATVARTSSSGSINPILGNGTGVAYSTGGTTTATWVVVTSSTTSLRFSPDATWTGSIDNVSVKEITPSDTLLALNNSNGTVGLAFRSGGASGSNTFAGVDVGRGNLTGTWNTGFGYASLYSNTTGSYNAAFGGSSLKNNTTGYQNVAMGHYTLYKNLSGYNNVAVGTYSLYENVSGYDNVGVGMNALYSNTSGLANTGVGSHSLWSNTTGSTNTAVGRWSLYSNTTGGGNVAVGDRSLFYNISGYNNVGIGQFAARYTNANNNVAIGYSSLERNTTGTYNVALGVDALAAGGTGSHNVALGPNALSSMTNELFGSISAIENYDSTVSGTVLVTALNHSFPVGTSAGVEITDTLFYDGTYSVTYVDSDHFYMTASFPEFAIVSFSDYSGTEPGTVLVTINTPFVPINMTAVTISGTTYYDGYYPATYVSDTSFYITESWMGDDATGLVSFAEENGYFNYDGLTLGDYNLAAGSQAGYELIRGANNTFLGAMTGTGSQASFVTNSTAIGYGAYTTADNQIVLGNTSVTQTLIRRGTLGLSETGVSPQYYTFFQGGDQSGDITYTLPTASTNGVLTNTGGVLSWVSGGGGGISQVGSMTSSLVFGDATADDDWLGLGASAGRIAFDDQTTDYVNILDAKVGIGDSSPLALLTVGSGDLFQIDSSGSVTSIDGIAHTIDDYLGSLRFTSNSDSIYIEDDLISNNHYSVSLGSTTAPWGNIYLHPESSIYMGVTGDQAYFYYDEYLDRLEVNGSTGTSFLLFDDFFVSKTSGNVGIGTTTPHVTFDVAGTGAFYAPGVKFITGSIDPAASTTVTGTGTLFLSEVDPGDRIALDGTATITGSIDPTASVTVTGVGTLFLSELSIGDQITVNAETRTVIAIASNTSLTVGVAFTDTANDTSIVRTSTQIRTIVSIESNTSLTVDKAFRDNSVDNQIVVYRDTFDVTGSALFKGGALFTGLGTPNAPTVTPQGTTGAATWTYKISAVNATGNETVLSANGSTATGNATLSGTNFNRITWSEIPGAASYRIYRVATGTSPNTTGYIGTVDAHSTLQFDDTGIGIMGGYSGSVFDETSNVGIGTLKTPPRDTLTVDGRINQTWHYMFEDFFGGRANMTATAVINAGNEMSFAIIGTSGCTASYPSVANGVFRMTSGATAALGCLLSQAGTAGLPNIKQVDVSLAPVLEVVLNPGASTSKTMLVGFTNQTTATVAEPTAGLYFYSSTAGTPSDQWIAVARNASVSTTQPTGVTVNTNTYQVLRIEASATHARYYINDVLVADLRTNIPAAGATLEFVVGHATTAAAAKTVDIDSIEFWQDDPVVAGMPGQLPAGFNGSNMLQNHNLYSDTTYAKGASEEIIPEGYVVSYTGDTEFDDNGKNRLVYNIVKAKVTDKTVLGIGAGLVDPNSVFDVGLNPYAVALSGPAYAWVEEGSETTIELGQELRLSNNTEGVLSVKGGQIIARTLERVDWSLVETTEEGQPKRKLVKVFALNSGFGGMQESGLVAGGVNDYFAAVDETTVQTPYRIISSSLVATTADINVLKARTLNVNDAFMVDDEGNVSAAGNLFAGALQTPVVNGVAGGLSLKVGAEEKLQVTVGDATVLEASVKGVTVNNLLVSDQQAGKVTLPAGQTIVTVSSTLAFAESIIVVTPSIPVITAVKTYEGYFEISLAGAVSQDVELGWYIVNINNE